MDRAEGRALLEDVAAGRVDVADAQAALGTAPTRGFTDLGFARLDTHRGLRTGAPEVVYGAGKTVPQVIALLRALSEQPSTRPALATRLTDEMVAAINEEMPAATVEPVGRCVAVGELPPAQGCVVVVSAGTSDEPVAAEAAFVARAFGAGVERVVDAGVAGIHRLIADVE